MAVLRRCLFVAIAAGLVVAARADAQTAAGEDQVKAAYLLNFARFVEWPADVLPRGAPLHIAIVGDRPFAGVLAEVLRGQSANGHLIQLREVEWNESLVSFHIVFISALEEAHLAEILAGLGTSSVLTVSDIERFSLRGGIIEFRMVGNRMRFDIDRGPAVAAALDISSKLLTVARAVRESRPAR